jgi:outer membrane lipoprotein-sorting protein
LAKTLLTITLLLSVPAFSQDDTLLQRVWDGVQAAQKKYTATCGTVTETRTSPLLARPLVFHGKYCAEGMNRFSLEYTGPDAIRLRYSDDYLNVTMTQSGEKTTQVLEVGHQVRRTQAYFSRENSIENLKRSFTITLRDEGKVYEMRLVPRSSRFATRVNYVVVKLLKDSFLLSSLEVDGKSGVHSVYEIQVTDLNPKINEEMFRVYKPK